jgi:hypothetical protein
MPDPAGRLLIRVATRSIPLRRDRPASTLRRAPRGYPAVGSL